MLTASELKNISRDLLPSPARSILKLLWSKYSFGTYRRRTVHHRFGGYEFQMALVDFDGEEWYDRDYAAFSEIELLRQHRLIPGARVFNAGANQCLQAMVMAKAVSPAGHVWAIEPNPHNANAGRRNLQLNGVTNCTVLDAAIANFDGRIMVNQAMNGQVSVDRWRIGALEVDAVTIDSLTRKLGPPDVLYIDIEGFEWAALEGAKETIRECAPDCFVEIHTQMGLEKLGGSVDSVLSAFPSSIYQLYFSDIQDGIFRELKSAGGAPCKRFFLVALANRGRAREAIGGLR